MTKLSIRDGGAALRLDRGVTLPFRTATNRSSGTHTPLRLPHTSAYPGDNAVTPVCPVVAAAADDEDNGGDERGNGGNNGCCDLGGDSLFLGGLNSDDGTRVYCRLIWWLGPPPPPPLALGLEDPRIGGGGEGIRPTTAAEEEAFVPPPPPPVPPPQLAPELLRAPPLVPPLQPLALHDDEQLRLAPPGVAVLPSGPWWCSNAAGWSGSKGKHRT